MHSSDYEEYLDYGYTLDQQILADEEAYERHWEAEETYRRRATEEEAYESRSAEEETLERHLEAMLPFYLMRLHRYAKSLEHELYEWLEINGVPYHLRLERIESIREAHSIPRTRPSGTDAFDRQLEMMLPFYLSRLHRYTEALESAIRESFKSRYISYPNRIANIEELRDKNGIRGM